MKHHYTYDGKKQINMKGKKGMYVVREYLSHPPEKRWWAIQLFGAVGSIAGEGATPEDAFEKAEM